MNSAPRAVRGLAGPPDRAKGTRCGGRPPALFAPGPPAERGSQVGSKHQAAPPAFNTWGPQLGPATGQAVHLQQLSQGRAPPSQPAAGLTSRCPAGQASPAPPAPPCESGLSHQWGPQLGPIHRPMPRRAALSTAAREHAASCHQHPPPGHFNPTAGSPTGTSPDRADRPSHQAAAASPGISRAHLPAGRPHSTPLLGPAACGEGHHWRAGQQASAGARCMPSAGLEGARRRVAGVGNMEQVALSRQRVPQPQGSAQRGCLWQGLRG